MVILLTNESVNVVPWQIGVNDPPQCPGAAAEHAAGGHAACALLESAG
jgi:hypothetical protein